jgi:hypothetical protein
MFRKLVGMTLVVCLSGLVATSTFAADDKDKKAETKEVKADITKIDVEKKVVSVKTEDAKKLDLIITADVHFVGPRGGVSKEGIKDDRVVVGASVVLVYDLAGKKLMEIKLPVRSTLDTPKPKEKTPDKDK